LLGFALAATLLIVGCTGSTEPASNIKADSVRLNAKGTANNGPAYSYFEYWKTSAPATKTQTVTRHWQAGTSGPFGEGVTGLSADTDYSFRVCGNDEGQSAVCAQTLAFKTAPDHDSVHGVLDIHAGMAGFHHITADASSGPHGENPTGTVTFDGTTYPVTCLKIDTASGFAGPRSAVGYSDTVIWFWATNPEGPHANVPPPGPADCSTPFPGPSGGFTNNGGPFTVEYNVVDAP
jgi:hypothetical protein